MLFAIHCFDKPDHLQVRLDARPAHLDHLRSVKERLFGVGPTLDGDGKPNGSLIIVSFDDISEAQTFAEADPYKAASLFDRVTVQPWNKVEL
jgi:uncharacterized protein YciI